MKLLKLLKIKIRSVILLYTIICLNNVKFKGSKSLSNAQRQQLYGGLDWTNAITIEYFTMFNYWIVGITALSGS